MLRLLSRHQASIIEGTADHALWSQGQLRISICQNRNVLGTKQVLDEDSHATRKSSLPCLTRIWTSFRKTKPSALPQYSAMRFSIHPRTVPLIAPPRYKPDASSFHLRSYD